MLGNIRHWLNDEPEIVELMESLSQIDRCRVLDKN